MNAITQVLSRRIKQWSKARREAKLVAGLGFRVLAWKESGPPQLFRWAGVEAANKPTGSRSVALSSVDGSIRLSKRSTIWTVADLDQRSQRQALMQEDHRPVHQSTRSVRLGDEDLEHTGVAGRIFSLVWAYGPALGTQLSDAYDQEMKVGAAPFAQQDGPPLKNAVVDSWQSAKIFTAYKINIFRPPSATVIDQR